MKSLTDLRKLRHVVGVARAGSFTSASNNLAITQSALTKSVADVESLLGSQLFRRLPRGVALTPVGEMFVPRAERILADAQELMSDLEDLQSLAAGQLRVGIAPAGFIGLLAPTLAAFAKVYPGIKIEVVDAAVEVVAGAVLRGEADLVVGMKSNLEQWSELEVFSVAGLHNFFISRLEHPMSAMDNVTALELMQYPMVLPTAGLTTQAQIAKAYVDAGLTPKPPQYVVDNFAVVERLVAATDAVAPVVTLAPPGVTFHEKFHVYKDVVPLAAQDLAVARPKHALQDGPGAAFIEIFRGFRQSTSAVSA